MLKHRICNTYSLLYLLLDKFIMWVILVVDLLALCRIIVPKMYPDHNSLTLICSSVTTAWDVPDMSTTTTNSNSSSIATTSRATTGRNQLAKHYSWDTPHLLNVSLAIIWCAGCIIYCTINCNLAFWHSKKYKRVQFYLENCKVACWCKM